MPLSIFQVSLIRSTGIIFSYEFIIVWSGVRVREGKSETVSE